MPILKKASTLHELLLNKLMALYDVEIQITKSMPKIVKKISNPDLRRALNDHLTETEGHVKRLEKCFKSLGEKPKKLSSDAIRGLTADATWITKHVEKGPTLDANIIAATRYVEHYEIAGYEVALSWANRMGHTSVEELLQATLAEEKKGDKTLVTIAKNTIDPQVDAGI